ncbi:MAG: nuclear transport factor 2 family protein [Rhodobacteraceae bacterium]|nr:nuclear transport factor 2 family protein [Paracoccaceae bacterium]
MPVDDFQDIKKLVRNYYADLDAAAPDAVASVLREYVAPDYSWRGMHPFNELEGAASVATTFWEPLLRSIRPIQRRPDVFMAGANDIKPFGGTWVCCMGHLLGLFDENWLGIPSTGKMVFFRFVEFHEVAEGQIVQTAHFFDIPSVMRQAGVNPFPPDTGQHFLTPGPRTHDGLLHSVQDPDRSRKTMDLINRMIDDLVGSGMESPQDELARTWHEDMIWFGPTGIGAAYTRQRYQRQHQGPFRQGLGNIVFNGHVCRFSEGRYGGFFGWPNLTMKPTGGFMGVPATDRPVDMRVVDIYRREGELLAENWIFIDLLHFFAQQGLDMLARMRDICRT